MNVGALVLAVLAEFASGCTLHEPKVTPEDLTFEVWPQGLRRADLLFVVDNSNDTMEMQMVLSRQMVLLVEELIRRGALDELLHPGAVDDLHMGVVSIDMGTGGHEVMTCNEPERGDDGVLQNDGQLPGCNDWYSVDDCEDGECPWLEHSTEHPDDGRDPSNPPIWEDFGCIAILGTGGCGFEQPLESSLAALTRQAEPGGPNHGFLRDDSVLAVVYITDEDDCSVANSELLDPARDDFGPMNVRCALNPDQLHPISRYHDGFLALRPGREDLVVVAAIAGIPVDGSWSPGDDLESLREMQQVDPSNPNHLLPSCATGMGLALPPVRIVELVYSFGDHGLLASCCRSDWRDALLALARMIEDNLPDTCVPEPLPEPWRERCRVTELTTDGRQVVVPVGGASTAWWSYIPGGTGDRCPSGRIDFTGVDFAGSSDVVVDCERGE